MLLEKGGYLLKRRKKEKKKKDRTLILRGGHIQDLGKTQIHASAGMLHHAPSKEGKTKE